MLRRTFGDSSSASKEDSLLGGDVPIQIEGEVSNNLGDLSAAHDGVTS